MKGLIKCSKFLALFAMPLLCLCQSSDVNAYKYDLDVIPFIVYNSPGGGGPTSQLLYQPLSFSSSEQIDSVSDDNFYFNLKDNGSGTCIYDSWHYSNYGLVNPDSFYIPAYLQPSSDYHTLLDSHCNVPGVISNLDESTLPPYVFGYPDLRSLLPYRYKYDGAYFHDCNTENGLQACTKLDLSDFFVNNVLPDSFTSIDLPLGYSELEFTPGADLDFSGRLYFDSDTPDTSVLTLGPSATVSIQSSLFSGPSDFKSGGGDVTFSQWCDPLATGVNPNSFEAPYYLDYNCHVHIDSTSSDSARLSGFTLMFRGDSSGLTSNPIWTYSNTSNIYFDSSFVITYSDDSPDPSGSHFQQQTTVSGNFTYEAPGSATSIRDIESDGVNWSESLRNLFDFSFVNPFSGIFGLFTDQNSCASIPIISSMIHSDETQVCPWFDSTTRNIVTPVLGLASVMLIFGFAVHWLGARSGNMFEDSVDTDNYSFSNKFRRKK